jgi:UDP-2-acetamido-3-amino-2,3-dideoxy-glucuronate N-acetyltransferase
MDLVGNPARQIGWMSRRGHRLIADPDGIMRCAESGFRYNEVEPGVVRRLDEECPLPPKLKTGCKTYGELKTKRWSWRRSGESPTS